MIAELKALKEPTRGSALLLATKHPHADLVILFHVDRGLLVQAVKPQSATLEEYLARFVHAREFRVANPVREASVAGLLTRRNGDALLQE